VRNRCGIFLDCSCIFLFDLLELFPYFPVFFRMSFVCLLYVVHMWKCLLFFIARMCSLYLVWNDRPVCPIYCWGQSKHFNLYIPPLSYLLFLRCFRCRCFRMVFVVLKAILVSVTLSILAVCCVHVKNIIMFTGARH
jgi:hypothetical protein